MLSFQEDGEKRKMVIQIGYTIIQIGYTIIEKHKKNKQRQTGNSSKRHVRPLCNDMPAD